jgi:hypothetical protein
MSGNRGNSVTVINDNINKVVSLWLKIYEKGKSIGIDYTQVGNNINSRSDKSIKQLSYLYHALKDTLKRNEQITGAQKDSIRDLLKDIDRMIDDIDALLDHVDMSEKYDLIDLDHMCIVTSNLSLELYNKLKTIDIKLKEAENLYNKMFDLHFAIENKTRGENTSLTKDGIKRKMSDIRYAYSLVKSTLSEMVFEPPISKLNEIRNEIKSDPKIKKFFSKKGSDPELNKLKQLAIGKISARLNNPYGRGGGRTRQRRHRQRRHRHRRTRRTRRSKH